MFLDYWVAALLFPLAIWVMLNGLDDLVIDFAAALSCFTTPVPSEAEIDAMPHRAMAIFVPLWKEHRVIQKMIQNNVRRVNYDSVHFFVGVYRNDAPTIAAVQEASRNFSNVHFAVTPHDGPTSKADNLNCIYTRMLVYEQEHDVRFDMILTHDAEDLIDPDGLRWINYFAQHYDMVQIPVLALPTPFREITHGVYCDEFAEFQFKDMPARQLLGGFIPSNGVGTGFSRRAIEALASAHGGQIFEPACLTEDYENGFRMRRLGFAQKFIPITKRYGRPVATREYFPRLFENAIKQKSRWITGITLQSWEFHDWKETAHHAYWFWRDRKSLISNVLTPLTNVLFFYGVFTWASSHVFHNPWRLGAMLAPNAPVYRTGFALQVLHTSIRMVCSAKIYGSGFALGVPVRVLAGNVINFCAATRAIHGYARAKMRRSPLRWVKTDHHYPGMPTTNTEGRSLGQILVENKWLTEEQLGAALTSKPADCRMGEHLLAGGWVTERVLYQALSLHAGLPFGLPSEGPVTPAVTRSLPVRLVEKWKVLPFRVAGGELFVAGTELPDEEMHQEIRRFSSLDLRFHLVTPREFRKLHRRYLGSDEHSHASGRSTGFSR